tara:strand:- start:797 stop:2185 length:1389 start_codon:yes stop_codon:yes gene_type:complete
LTPIAANSLLLARVQRIFFALLIVVSSIFASAPIVSAQAQLPEISAADSIRLPANFDLVDFYLITVDVGDQVWDNFGHTALRVVDRNTRSDLVFNWGLFDASEGNVVFASNFLQGILNYQLGVSPPSWEFGRYEREQRTVWQDKINLTNAQKETLYKRLAWNLREENIVYSYQYFFDNCTTRVRDYLNEALGGRLESENRALARSTFRDEVQSHYASIPAVAVSLDILMNGRIDRRMTQFEELFLPAQLRRELLSFPSDVLRNGQRVTMLEEPTVIMEFTPPTAQASGYYFVGAGLFAVVVFLFLMLRRVPLSSFSSQPGFTLRAAQLSYRVMGLLTLLLSIASGIYGSIMSFGWLASAHLDLHHNLNLLLFWPTDLLGAYFAVRWLIAGRSYTMSSTLHNVIILYFILHILAALAYVFVALTGIAEQEVASVLLYLVPSLIAFGILVWNAGFSPVRRMRFS